ncbi:cob(I)yrinic acid a,c-diamide adenosyltransferase [Lentilactobacillus kisonensis]|uniref:Corrinoid adenosyltransferase n=2 Tax=Lentilactobacillus kisonensis TaxID=481722 RepID=H1LK60_9LACO|nr:cob(I)yrinic acid a,c-diamide adenosyltransferase [Lentilactobacillus kisonensis]EHO48000.1 ATP:cob(I)alamin adenosyltransferase [Lentilactobacillus kisonensis F0435]KRL21642.1 ATP cob(I)alamin adenosyltransferase [Lentilactobacillus kisonensis DSM 19906 = JCM 15041]
MKIYTRAGDKGRTQIIGHQIVSKDDARVEAYGTTDELNSWVGYIISILTAQTTELADELEEIQQLLFDVGNDLANPSEKSHRDYKFDPQTAEEATKWLEGKIDRYTQAAPQVKKFILPGGSPVAAALQVARTVTRRAERRIVTLKAQTAINNDVMGFINRLSDYFFAAARYANYLDKRKEITYRNSKLIFR